MKKIQDIPKLDRPVKNFNIMYLFNKGTFITIPLNRRFKRYARPR